nr:immunoglobulin light chain junction region [Macaca mulatta]MOX09555.1 immunoglobulin light chain junction region [Macaca mulatta]
CMQGTKDVTF